MDRGHWTERENDNAMFNAHRGSIKRKTSVCDEEPEHSPPKRSNTNHLEAFSGVLNPLKNPGGRPLVTNGFSRLPNGPDLLTSIQQHHQPLPSPPSAIPAITFASPDYKPPPRELFHRATHTFATSYEPPVDPSRNNEMEVDIEMANTDSSSDSDADSSIKTPSPPSEQSPFWSNHAAGKPVNNRELRGLEWCQGRYYDREEMMRVMGAERHAGTRGSSY